MVYIEGYGAFIGFVLLSLAFGVAALVASWLFQPKNPNKNKLSTYECGIKPFGDARIKFDVKYYMYALLFLLFDIEAIFLFPWAVIYNKIGLYALIEAVIFIIILFIGLIYAIRKNLLEWK